MVTVIVGAALAAVVYWGTRNAARVLAHARENKLTIAFAVGWVALLVLLGVVFVAVSWNESTNLVIGFCAGGLAAPLITRALSAATSQTR